MTQLFMFPQSGFGQALTFSFRPFAADLLTGWGELIAFLSGS
jgi:hypothetical protein